MDKQLNDNFIREITPLSEKDCFLYSRQAQERVYISDAFAPGV